MLNSWEIEIRPHDVINPGFGYYVKIVLNGRIVLNTSIHPHTGRQLDFKSALEVASMYEATGWSLV